MPACTNVTHTGLHATYVHVSRATILGSVAGILLEHVWRLSRCVSNVGRWHKQRVISAGNPSHSAHQIRRASLGRRREVLSLMARRLSEREVLDALLACLGREPLRARQPRA